ncbi:hypothetical protein KAR91_07760 [Candidatus Pacearchaeota archaeon]|nr:hypothetical protein [Candidatus Pacearchaeota archaeon]
MNNTHYNMVYASIFADATTTCVIEDGKIVRPKREKYKRPAYCCKRFREELNSNIEHNGDGEMPHIHVSHWDEFEEMYITHCPFCGNKIRIVEAYD